MSKEDAIRLWRNRWVNRAARLVNKYVENRLQLRWAGRGTFYAGAIHHVGRKSGREYVTPVLPQPIPGGFVIGLPYGEDTDWCRNVLADGKATLAFKGESVLLFQPKVANAAEAEPWLPSDVVRHWRRSGMVRCRILQRSQEQAGASDAKVSRTG